MDGGACGPIMSEQWWYVDGEKKTLGPVSTAELVSLFAAGDVDGLTLVADSETYAKGGGVDDWRPLSEVPSLRSAAVDAAGDEEDESADEGEENGHELSRVKGNVAGANNVAKAASVGGERGDAVRTYSQLSPSQMVAPESTPVLPVGVEKQLEGQEAAKGDASTVGGDAKQPSVGDVVARDGKRISRKRQRTLQAARDRAARSLYVTGIAEDVDERDIASFFAKCGILMPDARTGQALIYLYKDETGRRKGDGRVTYAMEASVENALVLLDGVAVREGDQPISLERVSFDEEKVLAGLNDESKGENVKAKRQRADGGTAVSSKLRRAGHVQVRDALGWAEEDLAEGRGLRMVVLRNVFDPKEGVNYNLVRKDMEEGCGACGAVEKVTVFQGNADGVIIVKFRDGASARSCVELMNGRWYAKRKLSAEYYDGATDYRVKETAAQRGEREKDWAEWLGDESDGDAGTHD